MRVLGLSLVLLGMLSLLVLPGPADAQPVGSEFRVNTYTLNNQRPFSGHSIAADANGNFVVVWSSPQDGSGYSIFGQRFDASGTRLGAEFRVNSFTTGGQDLSAVAAAEGGEFVIVWTSVLRDGSGDGIVGQRYDSSGVRLGREFRVNSYTPNSQLIPSVATDASGNFVVVWESSSQVGAYAGIFGQRYDSDGQPVGAEFQVNTTRDPSQVQPEVASDKAGNFVVVWASHPIGRGQAILGQRYDSTGVPQGGEFRVHTSEPELQGLECDVASDADGNFVVVWYISSLDGSLEGVFGRRFDSAGVPQAEQFQINAFTPGRQWNASVASNGPNEFVVAWQSNGQDGSGYGVFGRRVLNPAGQAVEHGGDQRSGTNSSASAAQK